MKKGYMTVQVQFKNYLADLTGPNAKVWTQDGDAEFEGEIDKIEELYPDLWKHLIDNSFIKPM